NKAKYQLEAADLEANAIILNPEDVGTIERETTTDGLFIAGDGAAARYINNGLNLQIWGLPVVKSNEITKGKFVMMDTSALQLFQRQGVTVEAFEQDETNVQYNLVTIRCEARYALACYHSEAILYGDLEKA